LSLLDTPSPSTAEDGDELHEGVLRCAECREEYPIVAGTAVVLPSVRSWLRAHYYYILAGASQAGGIGSGLMSWLEARDWHLGNRFAYDYYEENRWIGMFAGSHYDPVPAADASDSPLAEICAMPNVFDVAIEMLGRHLEEKAARALDVGTNVGGMALRLAQCARDVVGIDAAFNPVLAARRIQLGRPRPLHSYRRYLDGLHYESRPLQAVRGNTEFLVGSAAALPVQGSFEVITMLGLVDVAAEPRRLLAQLAGVLAPGGSLLVSSPYSWSSDNAPMEQWVGASQARPTASQMIHEIQALGLEVLETKDNVLQILREHQRWHRVYVNHCILAKKKGGR
jgi:SAM-dependent methyltransferase